MNHYIFLTDEGITFQPGAEDTPSEIENLQVLGFASGSNADQAFKNLLTRQPYLKETTFTRFICYQLDRNYEKKLKYFKFLEI